MVDAVTNVFLETLRDLLVNEVKFLSGVSDGVTKVEEDLKFMYELLMEADDKRVINDSAEFRNCIDELKKLAFRAENVLEAYAVKVQTSKSLENLKRKLQRFMCRLCECHKVGNEVDDIRSGLANLTDRLRSLPRGEAGSSDQEKQYLSRISVPHEEVKEYFVGMEKDIDLVVSMLKDDSPHVPSIISICGMGGLGKTTLARKIYNHRDIQAHFNGFAWVCVTQKFQAETILRGILKELEGKKHEDLVSVERLHNVLAQMEYSALVARLHNVLAQRKCLIVIDDIWEEEHWRILKKAFPNNCKIVLTTRNANIASDTKCRYFHELDALSEDEGWDLLRKIAELPTNMCESKSTSLEGIGRKLVRDCGRLPLTIKVIGGILHRREQTPFEWREVSSNIDSYLKGEERSDIRIKSVLDLSFNVLPYHLKHCFLYLACFSEDEEIDTEQLYLLWMAEGLISSEKKGNNETLRDVAECYLTDLALRCMVQVTRPNFNIPHKKYESCRLHDLMRELCSTKSEQEKFMKRVDVSKQQQGIPSAIRSSVHRLAINVDDYNVATTLSTVFKEELKHLRSFLVLRKDYFGKPKFENAVKFENSEHLRILVFNGVGFVDGNLPSTIGKLIHLKYLSLNSCYVEELPKHVCYLPFVHTLDLRVRVLKLPNLIRKMKRLKHLFLPDCFEVIGGDKLKLDGLNELETLTGVDSVTVCIASINLTSLRSLSVEIIDDKNSLSKIVDHMSSNGCQLRETILNLKFCDLRNVLNKMLMSPSLIYLQMHDCEFGSSFPSYRQDMCPKLIYLYMQNSRIEGDLMDVLGKFPMLQELHLNREIFKAVKIEMRFGVNSFPELKRLELMYMKNLYKWELEKEAMPKLLNLVVSSCENLDKLPDGLKFISTLEELSCHYMSEEFKGKYKKGGENGEGEGEGKYYANISHIPSIYIG